MIIEVPFLYKAVFKRVRKRTEEKRKIKDIAYLEIKEVDEKEAPIVLTMQSQDQQYYREDGPRHIEMRAWNGSLWRQPIVHKSSGGEQSIPTVDDLKNDAKSFRDWYTGPSSGIGTFWPSSNDHWQFREALEDLNDPDIREVISTTRDADLARLQQSAQRFIILNGQILVESPEPILAMGYLGYRPSLEIGFLDKEGRPSEPGRDFYRADRLDAVIAKVEDIFGPLSDEDRLRFTSKINVLHPEFLTFADEEFALSCVIEAFYNSLPSFLREGSKDYLCAYADWRDFRGKYPATDLESQIRYLEPVISSLDGDGRDDATQDMRKALERWYAHQGLNYDDMLEIDNALAGGL